MSTEILTSGGILRAGEVVELAAAHRLDLACAAVLLVKESSGGRNVWGSDPVQTGGTYTKGAPVTRADYERYLAVRGPLGAQGVGPCQLTWPGFQDRADARGGCWNWRTNVAVGFEILADLIRRHGVREGFRRYNGAGHAAERYADDAMGKLATWRARLAPAAPSAPTRPPLSYGMRSHPTVRAVQLFLARAFPAYAGDLPATGNYLNQTVAVVREFQARAGVKGADANGRDIGPRTWAALAAHGYR